jgi:hypothetical protein
MGYSPFLAVQTESHFSVSPQYPRSHFGTIAESLDSHLLVFEIAFDRIPRASFQSALIRKGLKPNADHDEVGRSATVDVVFCRDLIDEVDHQDIRDAMSTYNHRSDHQDNDHL